MKRSFLLLIVILVLLPVSAQEFAVLESSAEGDNHVQIPVLVDDIDRIASEKDSEANEVVTIYLKDGSVCRALSKDTKTGMNFFKYVPYDMPITTTTEHLNDYQLTWNVSGVGKQDGFYSVGVTWYQMDFAYMQNEHHGICIGTSPNLTVENSEHVLYVDDRAEHAYNHKYDSLAHYMFIGPRVSLPHSLSFLKSRKTPMGDWRFGEKAYSLSISPKDAAYLGDIPMGSDNWLDMPLEYGKTYYYRPFSQGDVMQQGEMKPMVFYDVEKSFRVPYVMEDAGYDGFSFPTEEACVAFSAHFSDSVTAPAWEQLEPLWQEWQLTAEAKQVDLSVAGKSFTFDNGTIYKLDRIPDEFYSWLTHREIVIDAFGGIAKIAKTKDSKGDLIETSTANVVYPDESLQVPGGKYVRFEPVVASKNIEVTYRSREVIPGIRYKLQISFAPEEDETAEMRLPTKVSVYSLPMSDEEVSSSDEKQLFKNQEIPATIVTTLESDNVSTQAMGIDIRIATNITNSEYRYKTYNRILRIAEIRLIPVDN